MKTAMVYEKQNPWIVKEGAFHQDWLGKVESTMYLGNGYMGVRSATEESYVNEKRGTFVAGTFNKFDENEVTELPNSPDVIAMEFRIDGERLDLTQGETIDYQRTLNLQTGELERRFIWQYQQKRIQFTFKRIVSFANQHIIAQSIELTSLNGDSALEVISGIDGQLTNSGSQHFTEGDKALIEGQIMQMSPKTTQSNISVICSTTHKWTDVGQNTQPLHLKDRIEMGRRKIYKRFWLEMKKGQTVRIEKISSIHTSIDLEHANHSLDEIKQLAVRELHEASKRGYSDLADESARAWMSRVWEHLPITIQSTNETDQLALNFAKYHLHAMTPAHDERMNIGAKGLSGEGYKGHTFWDTEIFMLPYFTFTHPAIAKKLVTYRYLGLTGAHKKAHENGYEGAQFPWEAAWPDDGETTPVWGAADIITGKATKIWSGFIEQHITSDVAFGVKQYIDVTDDKCFAREKGYEIIFDTAKFWASRLEWQPEKKQYEILDVIGPDEYKEHANNNAFTNYTAHWNMTLAIKLYEELQQHDVELWKTLSDKLELERVYPEWLEKVDRIYLPKANENCIIPQDDEYLSKKVIDLTKYKMDEAVGTLFHDYNLEQVNNMQVTKQADVLLLLFLFEHLFTKEEKVANWNYYEPKTTHDSSLSLSTHAILAADLGESDEAYRLFRQAAFIDLGEHMNSSNEGIHAASLGGVWQATVFGFGGVRALNGQLRIEPHLPKEWDSLQFGIEWQGNPLVVTVTKEQISIENNGKKTVEFVSKGQQYQIQTKNKIVL